MGWVVAGSIGFVLITPTIAIVIAPQEIYRRRSCFGGAVISVVGGRGVVAVAVAVLVKPLCGVAGKSVACLIDMKAGGGVDIVGVNALVAITIKVGIQRTLIGAAVG